jgi:hypothetical protein
MRWDNGIRIFGLYGWTLTVGYRHHELEDPMSAPNGAGFKEDDFQPVR